MNSVVTIVGADAAKFRNKVNPDVVFCLRVPNHLLYSWYISDDDDCIELINASIYHRTIKIASSSKRLHDAIRRKVSYIGANYGRKSWRKRPECLMKFTLFDVMYDEPVSIDELESQIEMLNESVKEYKLV